MKKGAFGIAIGIIFPLACFALGAFWEGRFAPWAQHVVFDLMFLVGAIAFTVQYALVEPGLAERKFWLRSSIAFWLFFLTSLLRIYILPIAGVPADVTVFLNIIYIPSLLILLWGVAILVMSFNAALNLGQKFAIGISGFLILGLFIFVLIPNFQKDIVDLITLITEMFLSVSGITMFILAMALIFKTRGGKLQQVFFMISCALAFLVLYKVSYISDLVRGFQNDTMSWLTLLMFSLCMVFALISTVIRNSAYEIKIGD